MKTDEAEYLIGSIAKDSINRKFAKCTVQAGAGSAQVEEFSYRNLPLTLLPRSA